MAKSSRIIPGSECMNRLVTTRSDIRIRPRGLAYRTHWYYTGHIIASYCFQSLIRIFAFNHILLQISYFKKLTREHKTHNYLSFGHLLFICSHWQKAAKWQINVTLCSLVNLLKYEICSRIWVKANIRLSNSTLKTVASYNVSSAVLMCLVC